MHDFYVKLKKDYHRKGGRKGSRTIFGTIRVAQVPDVAAAEGVIKDLMALHDFQTNDARITWGEQVDLGVWEYTDFTFEVCEGETEQLEDTTPMTRENVLKWAEAEFAKHPTYTEQVYDSTEPDINKRFKDVSKPNSVARILGLLLLQHNMRQYEQEKAHDLLESIQTLIWSGTKAINSYTVDEALDELESECFGPDSSWDFESLEDLLCALGGMGEPD